MGAKEKILPINIDGQVVYASVKMLGGEEEVALGALSFDGVVAAIEGIAKKLTSVFDTIKPQKAVVEFNVQLSADAGKLTALLVSSKGSASMRIGLEWGASRVPKS